MKPESENTNIKTYLEGLKKYKERGIPILIDGKKAKSSEWQKLFQVCEDGSFYMGDYVLAEVPAGESGGGGATGEAGVRHRQRLKEIRFDKVYYR